MVFSASVVDPASLHAASESLSRLTLDSSSANTTRLASGSESRDQRTCRFQAEAEQRRAAARAREQEMVAEVQQNRAKVVLAEAEIPQAIAQSFRDGNLGIMDYYRLRNLQADTDMRKSLGDQAGPQESGD